MLSINDLSLKFNQEVIFSDFNLSLNQGEKLLITGESGVGKSTLFQVLLGFLPDYKGRISINNLPLTIENITKIRQLCAWLPQNIHFNDETVKSILLKPFNFAANNQKQPKQDKIEHLLRIFNLPLSILNKNINTLSGGQAQRILLIGSLLLEKPLVLLDEPSSAMDAENSKIVADYIFSQTNLTAIIISHDDYWIKKSRHKINL